MISVGLSHANLRLYEAALATSHRIRITITIRDHNEETIASLKGPHMLSGEVTMDTSGSVTRSLTLGCLDPGHKLHFDSTSPANGAMYADNFISIDYGIWVTALNDWVDVPVFWGPVTSFERNGPEVTIEAQGKESLGVDPILVPAGYTIRKGTLVQNAIKNVMNRLGETRYSLEMLSGRLHTHRTVAPQESPWEVCVGGGSDGTGNAKPSLISKSGRHQYLFYNGHGVLTAKLRGGSGKFTFTGAHLTTHPTWTFDVENVRNHAVVTGGTPKKSKHHYKGTYSLPAAHPLSPYALRRNGHNRFMTTFFQSDGLKSNAACVSRAKSIVLAASAQGVTGSFECLPIPHLEEFDPVTVVIDEYAAVFPLTSYTLPLTADTAMSVGFTKSVRPNAGQHKRRKR